MKTERHISLAHLHLKSTKLDSLITFIHSFEKLRLSFVVARSGRWETHFSFAVPSRLKKLPLICRPVRVRWKAHFSFAGSAQPVEKVTSHLAAQTSLLEKIFSHLPVLRSGAGPCRHLKIILLIK